MKQTDSLRKRFLSIVFTNFIGFILSILTAGILPRALGAVSFGTFNYLTTFFNNLIGFFDMGTSTCFYVNYSQDHKKTNVVVYYVYLSGLIIFTTLVFTLSLLILNVDFFWPHTDSLFVVLSLVYSIIVWSTNIVNKIIDASGETFHAEMSRLKNRVLSVVIIILLYKYNLIDLVNYFYYNYLIMIMLLLVWIYQLYSSKEIVFTTFKLTKAEIKKFNNLFYTYTNPLFVYTIISQVMNIGDRWLLQNYSGSFEQGLFSLSHRATAIVLLFTSAISPLLSREFSIAFGGQDIQSTKKLIQKYFPIFFTLTSYFSVFLSFQAKNVVLILGGEEYLPAILTLKILMFTPIAQVTIQIASSYFYSNNLTRDFRNITLLLMTIGLIGAYFLIVPSDGLGLGLGAYGLAIKTAVYAFATMYVMLVYICKRNEISIAGILLKQFSTLFFFVLCAVVSKFFVDIFGFPVIISFLITGLVYSVLCIAFLFVFPGVASITRSEMVDLIKKIYVRN